VIQFSTTGWRLAVLGVTLVVAGLTPAAADELWDSASRIVAANEQWVALEIRASMEQSNNRGEVVSRGETVVERAVSGSTVATRSVDQSGENPPQAEALLGTGLAGPATSGDEMAIGAIFDPAAKAQIGLRREPREGHTDAGARAVVYRFSRRRTDDTVANGTVWIDPATGVPLQMNIRNPAPAAPLVESETTVEFNPSPTAWYPLHARTRGVARRTMVERRFTMEVEFARQVNLEQ